MRIISVIVIARLLTPDEIGLFAIAASILALGQAFRNMGIAQYLVREKDLTREKIEAALFVSWCGCLLLSASLYFGSSVLAEFYESPALKELIIILSIAILFIPFGVVDESSIVREMRFKRLAAIEATSSIANVIVSITLAMNEFGAISLAYAAIASQIASVIGLRVCSVNKERYTPKTKGLKLVTPFILKIGGANIISLIGQQGQPLFIGKVLGPQSVAYFDKGFAVIQLLNEVLFSAIQKVLLPIFSEQARSGEAYKASYLKITSICLAIAWPFLAYLYLFSELIITTLYGHQWQAAVPLIPYLCIGAAIYNISRYHNELLISCGYEKRVLFTNALVVCISLLCVAIFSHFGLEALVASLLLSSTTRLIYASFNIFKLIGIRYRDFIKVLWQNIAVLVMTILPALLILKLTTYTDYYALGISAVLSLICWVAILELIKHPLHIGQLAMFNKNKITS
jgi:O-antigen/teichoic acid export membrane protein